MPLSVTRDVMDRVLAQVRSLTVDKVYVGIPADNDVRSDGAPINNAAIGYIQEHGSPANNLPARPFLVPGVQAIQDGAVKRMATGARQAMDGKDDAAAQTLGAVGLLGQNSVRRVITEKIPPQIAVSTAIGRLTRTATGKARYAKATPEQRSEMIEGTIATATPLVVTGQLRNSITYVIRKT